MAPMHTVTNVTTAVLAGLTGWMIVARHRTASESNWPLVYYAAVVAFSARFPDRLDPSWVYGGLVCALLLRFEFMAGIFEKAVRLLDYLALGYILYATATSVRF